MNPLPLSGPSHHRRADESQSKLTRYAPDAIFDAGRRTRERVNPEHVPTLPQRNFGRSGGILLCALPGRNMGGAEVRVAAI